MEPYAYQPPADTLYQLSLTFGYLGIAVLAVMVIGSLIYFRKYLHQQRPAVKASSSDYTPVDTFNDSLYGFGLEDYRVDDFTEFDELLSGD